MRRFRIVITATVLFSLLAASQAHTAIFPKLEWSRSYDGPGTYYDKEQGWGIALDAAGNVYVTGYEYCWVLGQGYNIWLRKYDTDGNTLWTETYDSPDHGGDYGHGVAVDAAGNVYVTGSEVRDDQGANIWLRKYDTDGNVLWTETYDSPDHGNDYGYGVAVDAAGNVYVTGKEYREDLGQNDNIWLRKYDTDGNTLWTETYNSPAHGYDYGAGVALDAAGNVYVTGGERNSDLGQRWNIWLRKYDTDGNTLWTETYDSPAHDRDDGLGVAVDSAGNVYVTGISNRDDLGQYDNIWLRKYDTDGNTLWTETYDSPAHHVDKAYGVALDDMGNVYVTGQENRSDLGQGTNLFLRKYDPDGNTLWTMSYNGEPVGTATFVGYGVAVDALGNVCVTGYEHWSGSYDDIMVLKFSQVPEPSTLLLLAPALFGFAGLLRRRLR